MKISEGGGGGGGRTPKLFRHPEGDIEKIVGLGGEAPKILYTSKATHDIIIQIGWFSTQQF